MKIGTLLGLAIAVALVVLVMRWLRGRAAQQPRAINPDAHSDATPAVGYYGIDNSDERATKGDNASAGWVGFDSKNASETKADSSTDSGGDSGGGDGGGGD